MTDPGIPDKPEVTVELWENNRWYPLTGWRGGLLPTDRPHYSNRDGTEERRKEHVKLPPRYEWSTEWEVYINPDSTDSEGWEYAVDFPSHFHKDCHKTSCVRRKKWLRTMKKSTRIGQLPEVEEEKPTDYYVAEYDGTSREPGSATTAANTKESPSSTTAPPPAYQEAVQQPQEVRKFGECEYVFGADNDPNSPEIQHSHTDEFNAIFNGFVEKEKQSY